MTSLKSAMGLTMALLLGGMPAAGAAIASGQQGEVGPGISRSNQGISSEEWLENTGGTLREKQPIKTSTGQQEPINKLIDKARHLRSKGKNIESTLIWQEIILAQEALFGSDSPEVAASLDELAYLYSPLLGQNDKAIPLYLRAISIYDKGPTDSHPEAMSSLNNLAMLYQDEGQYNKAELLFSRALALMEKALGRGHPETAIPLQNLAYTYLKKGNHGKAESLFLRALDIRMKMPGSINADAASILNDLAYLYSLKGEYEKSERAYQRAIKILEKSLGPNDSNTAAALHGLSWVYQLEGNYQKALALNLRVKAIFEKTFGSNHSNVAAALNDRASIYRKLMLNSKAEALSLRALEIWEKEPSGNPLNPTRAQENLALIYLQQGNYKKADPLVKRVLFIREKMLGINHLDVTTFLNNVALAYLENRKFIKGIHFLKRASASELKWIEREVPVLPVRTRTSQLRLTGYWMLPMQIAEQDHSALELAYENRLNRQGLLAEIQQKQTLTLKADPGLQKLIENLQGLQEQITRVSLPIERRKALLEKKDRLEAELYMQMPELKLSYLTITEVAKALPKNGILIEFQRYNPYDFNKAINNRWGAAQYLALILTPIGTIKAVNLGAAEPLEKDIHLALLASQANNSDAEALWGAVSRRILTPLAPHLAGAKQIFLSPDGELNRVPFTALPSPQNSSTPFGASVQLRLLTTGRDLIRLQQPSPPGTRPAVVANPSFDRLLSNPTLVAAAAAMNDLAPQQRSADIKEQHWASLPATEIEGRQIGALLGVAPINGEAATTLQLQRLAGPTVLHVATHGFFLLDQTSKQDQGLALLGSGTPALQVLSQEDPQLRSGLVLAGANQPDADPNDDGYLTAAEAVTLNLKGTELVVLSACSTGQGDVRTGEGVYGLQRSLTVAGARSTLLSLWKVDDAATAEFMTRFYKRLKAGESRSDALASTQQEFRNGIEGKPEWKQPYYWAAWQLVGDWRPIKGL